MAEATAAELPVIAQKPFDRKIDIRVALAIFGLGDQKDLNAILFILDWAQLN